jgi:S-adenosylmethionine uptake transporter
MQALWMLLASAMFALMGSAVKLSIEQGASLPEVVLFRGMPSVVLLLIFARSGRLPLISPHWRRHIWRNIAGVSSMWLGFVALSHLPLATATSLNYTAPLFIACWMLGWGGAQRDPVRIAAVVLGFLGVVTMLRPSISGDEWIAAMFGLGAGAMSAVAMMQIRQLGSIGEPEWRTVLYFSIAVCLSSVIGVSIEGFGRTGPTGYLALGAVGLTGLCGQLALTRAFGLGSPLLTAALQYTTIIFAALLGVGFFGDQLDAWAWGGIGLIIFAGLLSVWRTMRESRVARPA